MIEALLATNVITLILLAFALRANRRWARACRTDALHGKGKK